MPELHHGNQYSQMQMNCFHRNIWTNFSSLILEQFASNDFFTGKNMAWYSYSTKTYSNQEPFVETCIFLIQCLESSSTLVSFYSSFKTLDVAFFFYVKKSGQRLAHIRSILAKEDMGQERKWIPSHDTIGIRRNITLSSYPSDQQLISNSLIKISTFSSIINGTTEYSDKLGNNGNSEHC